MEESNSPSGRAAQRTTSLEPGVEYDQGSSHESRGRPQRGRGRRFLARYRGKREARDVRFIAVNTSPVARQPLPLPLPHELHRWSSTIGGPLLTRLQELSRLYRYPAVSSRSLPPFAADGD
ncbi:hypothetical protein AXG93_1333s1140 [Marchantia polymorpha subsp. ruderalis]|uniref:Uncharacterized protein n=1 Tax=Marchantia polymorpha subsp. ruderalis TaxID=1480154 RepID=A0A176WRM2_MARPO|nr:hypothetical protein AXG93_1333s1140 [Marchantia polymorpha subsp. ruderalis]